MTRELLISAAGLGLSSLLGSILGLIIRRIPHSWNDVLLGFCAGMMLTASIVCLIMPAIEMSTMAQWWQIAVGITLGVILIGLIDKITPHLHHISGIEEPERHTTSVASLNRTLLFVTAIALHKLPEGLATGISFNGDTNNAIAVTITIALQNIPEGMVVVTPLLMVGVRFINTALIAVTIALIEVIGMFVGYFIGDISALFLPVMLAIAGGAMLYVISDEMIPETHAHGYQKYATYALVAGVFLMLLIETSV